MIGLLALLLMAGPHRDSMALALRQAVASTSHAAMRWGDIDDVRPSLALVYADRSWQPLWTVAGRPTSMALGVLRELDSAATRGLDPLDYDVRWLRAAVAGSIRLAGPAAAEFDVVMSAAASRYAIALSHGRLDPRVLDPEFAVASDTINVVALLQQLASATRPDSVLRALEPRDAPYRILMEWLADYRTLAAGTGTGSGADSVRQRIRQIELTLERQRWLPQHPDGPIIVINVPAFQLYMLTSRQDGDRELLSMDVVVGRAAGHKTPQLTTSIVEVVFRPEWLVPDGVARKEIRPAALRDQTFLDRHHYQLRRADSILPNTPANARRIGRDVAVRQLPGEWNALGRVKFLMPNNSGIFLHDTPEQDLFERDRRDFSHGCVRVADPQDLAGFVLAGEPAWNTQRIAAAFRSESSLVVRLTHPIPVYIVYQTLVPTRFADVLVYPDVYGEDARLDEALRRGYPYPRAPSPR